MIFTPRVSQILFLLLNSKEVLAVKDLAEQLHISRRTIYRELKDIDKQLQKYHVCLETIPGKGLCLEGDEDGKRILLEEIKSSDVFDPKNREHRQDRLTLELLKQKEAKKLFYYALLLKVSETTVNNDLEQLAEWFLDVNLKIKKKPGLGIYLEGKEADYREACLRYMNENREHDFLRRIKGREKSKIYALFDRYYVESVYEILWKRKEGCFSTFTESSFITFLCYLSLAVQRMKDGRQIVGSEEKMMAEEDPKKDLEEVIDEVERFFHIRIPEAEWRNLYIYYRGAKLQYFNTEKDLINSEHEIKCLVLEMIECFEPDMRVRLKNDEEFLKALIAHLKPTLIRLKHNIKIENPFLQDIKEMYSAVFEKARAAAEVIYQHIGLAVPEEEVGMLAVHFGGAIVYHEKEVKYKRRVEIGIVCSSGIGISRLLASRIEQIFQEEVNITVLVRSKIKDCMLQHIDFLVSTFDLSNVKKDAIMVNPMLNEQDVKKVREKIDYYSEQARTLKKKEEKEQDLLNEVTKTVNIGNDIGYILKGFAVYEIDAGAEFEEVIRYAGEILGESPDDRKEIYEAILKREQLASQIVPEYEMALLHARTKGVEHPQFILVFPEGERFYKASLKGIKVVMVMLLPDIEEESMALVAVSNAIFDHDEFMESIVKKEKKQVEEYLQFYLREFLKEQLKSML